MCLKRGFELINSPDSILYAEVICSKDQRMLCEMNDGRKIKLIHM